MAVPKTRLPLVEHIARTKKASAFDHDQGNHPRAGRWVPQRNDTVWNCRKAVTILGVGYKAILCKIKDLDLD